VRQEHQPLRILTPPDLARRLLRSRLTRRSLLGGALALGGGAALAGCGGEDTPGSSGGAVAGTGPLEDRLSMYSWGEYDDPEVLKEFTRSKGPRVEVTGFNSNEEMIAKLVAAKGTGGYDIVVPTGPYIPQMVENQLLQPLSHDALPNRRHVDPEFLDQPWDPGNRHSVVKAWGTTGFAYDRTRIRRELRTWADFLDAAENEASGETSVLDAPPNLTGLYFWANDIDWNTTDAAHLDAAEDYLVNQLARHIKAFDSFPGPSMPQGSYMLVQLWNGEARQGILASKDPSIWQWVLGAPKTELWMDNWCIPTGAPHPNAAHAFINYVLDPEVSLREMEYIGYHTGVTGIEDTARRSGYDLPELVFFTPEQLATMVPGKVTEAQQRQVDIWNKMKAAAGR
jgi:spermidine/putrescine transport system substrate-binding protein